MYTLPRILIAENDLSMCATQLKEFIDMYDEIPYQMIHFLTYDINYGGRVTDDVDRRTICTILDDFINPKVVQDGYAFSSSGQYRTLPAGNQQQYVEHIRTMPLAPHPEVFGMHENADITSAQDDTLRLFSAILQLLPRNSVAGGKSREETISECARSIQKRLPEQFDMEGIMKRYPTVYEESMNTVLVQVIQA